jgi:hypothetical protein
MRAFVEDRNDKSAGFYCAGRKVAAFDQRHVRRIWPCGCGKERTGRPRSHGLFDPAIV